MIRRNRFTKGGITTNVSVLRWGNLNLHTVYIYVTRYVVILTGFRIIFPLDVPRMVRGISPVGTDSGLSWSFNACWSTYLQKESRGEQEESRRSRRRAGGARKRVGGTGGE